MVRSFLFKLLLAFSTVVMADAQTKLDLEHQSRSIDFTGATYTKPIRIGTSLPGTCGLAEAYILSSAPAGQNLYFCLAPNAWTLEAGSSGSGSGSTPNVLTTATSGPNLTIGSSCSISSPCNVRVNGTVYAFTASANASLTAGTGTAYVYISSSGVLTVGHNLTLTCTTGCTAASGITQFPANSIPLATWTASSGTWGTGTDLRSFFSIDNYIVGTGLLSTLSSTSAQLSIDTSLVPTWVSAPASSGQTCTTNTLAKDTSYLYVCTAGGTWMRAAFAAY